ncbi:protein rep [Enterococcus faecalis]|nr:protein rep [Enterococcus faecalis]
MTKSTNKKRKNNVLTYFMEKLVLENRVTENTLKLIKECNTFMMMIADETLEKKKQHKGNSCKNRFCPICAWKKSRKNALALSVMMAYLKQEEKKEFIFLTLTAPNVPAEELNDEIKHYNQSFQRLMQRKEVSKVVKGYARKLEITYNEERDDYHPHFHVLIAVNKSYFTDKNYYISRDRWLELWQQVTKNPLITQVDVRKVKNGRNDKVYEIAKYSAKDSEYLVRQDVFEVFYKALKGKRLIVYSGLFKDAMTKFKAGELDSYKEKDTTEYVYAIMYNWGDRDYIEMEKRYLTADELEEVNGKLIDEMEVEERDG